MKKLQIQLKKVCQTITVYFLDTAVLVPLIYICKSGPKSLSVARFKNLSEFSCAWTT